MWSWNSLNTLAQKAQQQLDVAAKNLGELGKQANVMANKFIEEQTSEYKQVKQTSELQTRRKSKRHKIMKYSYPPWHIHDDSDSSSSSSNTTNTNNTNTSTNLITTNTNTINNNDSSSSNTNTNTNTNATDIKNNGNVNNNNNNNIENKNELHHNNNDNNDNDNDNDNDDHQYNIKQQLMNELKLRILKICEDEHNFLIEAPTSEAVFEFNMETAMPYANAALKQDPILGTIRFKLVPKKISEKQFWKNYFYRVQLIRESMGIKKLNLAADAEVPLDMSLKEQEEKLNMLKNQKLLETNHDQKDGHGTKESLLGEDEELRRLPDMKKNNRIDSILGSSNDTSGSAGAAVANANTALANNSIDKKKKAIGDGINGNGISKNEGSNGGRETSPIRGIPAESDSSYQGVRTNLRDNNRVKSQKDGHKRPVELNEDEDNDFMENMDPDIDHLSAEEREKMNQELGLTNKNMEGADDVNALLEGVEDNGEEIDEAELANIVSEVGGL